MAMLLRVLNSLVASVRASANETFSTALYTVAKATFMASASLDTVRIDRPKRVKAPTRPLMDR